MKDDVRRIRAGDLRLITKVVMPDGTEHVLQRHESDSHILSIGGPDGHGGSIWDDALVGVLTVHALIDHPTEPGVLHIGEGGSRWRAKTDGSVIPAEFLDPDYTFLCDVKPVTVQESARIFIGMSKGRKQVPKLDEYFIALTAKADWALAIQQALTPLVVSRFPHYGNGTPGKVAAVGVCETVVRNSYKASKNWEDAALHLQGILGISRRAFSPVTVTDRDEAAYAHDGTLIGALSWIILKNSEKLAKEANRQRISDKLSARPVSFWKGASEGLSSKHGVGSGSGGRPLYLAAVIVDEYNKRLHTDKHLVGPKRIIIE